MFSAARPPSPAGAGNPIGISTAIIAGASAARRTSANRGSRPQPELGAAFALVYTRDGTIQPAEQPSTPTIQQSPAA
jgi:hypothetical protein